MGQALPKAVESIVVERHGDNRFRVGMAEMNGQRNSMEDAHAVILRESWGFFGVFDGHGGSQCSSFVAKRLNEEFGSGEMPPDDAAVKALMLKVDQEFLDSDQQSGSTGTFLFIEPAPEGEARFKLRIGNIGDSRVLLGRADGSMVEGTGTDGGMTTDHKPDHPTEHERIWRTGGRVEKHFGVARVNGDLAVSRAFGDAKLKQTGGPEPENRPVSAEPEFTTIACDSTDFVVLVCDGISEGEFPNRSVIELVAEMLREGGGEVDLALIASAVCQRALDRGSKDNLSCMVLQFAGPEATPVPFAGKQLLPGPYTEPKHREFRKAWAAMADRAGLSFAQALELRYTAVQKMLANPEPKAGEEEGLVAALRKLRTLREEGVSGAEDEADEDLKMEAAVFDNGPPSDLKEGSPERVKWFEDWLVSLIEAEEQSGPSYNHAAVADILKNVARVEPRQAPERLVQVASLDELRKAVDAHDGLEWKDESSVFADRIATLECENPQEQTSKVRVHVTNNTSDATASPKACITWLPNSVLTPAESEDVPDVPVPGPESPSGGEGEVGEAL